MVRLPDHLRPKLPFLAAAFASLALSVWLYFVADQRTTAIFVGLWVPSIHSLGALVLTPVARDLRPHTERAEVRA